MGDGQAVASQGQPERGIGGCIDHTQPDPLTWPRGQHGRRPGPAAVDQVQRVTNVAGVIAKGTRRLGRHLHRVMHAAHAVVHAWHLGMVHAVRQQAGQDLVGRLADPIGPVVEDDDGLAVVAAGLGRVLDDQHAVQAAVQLHPGMGVEEVGAGVGDRELIDEAGTGGDRGLGEPGDAVHVVADCHAVPVDAGRGGQVVVELDAKKLTGAQPQLRPRHRAIERPRLGQPSSKVHNVGCGAQSDSAIRPAHGEQRASLPAHPRRRPNESQPIGPPRLKGTASSQQPSTGEE